MVIFGQCGGSGGRFSNFTGTIYKYQFLRSNSVYTTFPKNGDFSLEEGSVTSGWSIDGTECDNPITKWIHVLTSIEEPQVVHA